MTAMPRITIHTKVTPEQMAELWRFTESLPFGWFYNRFGSYNNPATGEATITFGRRKGNGYRAVVQWLKEKDIEFQEGRE
jgi:hypothetical protein